MRPKNKISLKDLILLVAVLSIVPLGGYLVDRFGFWTILLALIGIFLLMVLFIVWISSPKKEQVKTKEIEYEYSRKVQVPPEFFFATFCDAEFRCRISDNLLDIYIDQEEVGGYIVSTVQTPKGTQTNCTEITNWNPPFELGTQITLESHAGSATTIHHYHFEKIPTGTFYKVQSRVIYTGMGMLSFMISSFVLKRSFKKSWTKITNEVEKEYVMRKNQEMAI